MIFEKKLIRFDWAIKKLLRSKANFDILEGFLSELLYDDIKIKTILASESNKEDAADKFNRVDILVENKKGELIIIEVQNDYEYDYLLRMHYGTSKVSVEHKHQGDIYAKAKKVISINIVYFDLGQGEDYVYHGTTNFIGIHKHDELQLTARLKQELGKKRIYELYPEYYILKVNQFNDLAKDSLDEWIYFLKNSEVKAEFKARGLQEAARKLDIMKLDTTQRKVYQRYLENLSYAASMAKSIKIEAEEMIRKEGIEQGSEKKQREIVTTMNKNGLTYEKISKYTGIPQEEVKKILGD